MKLEFWQVVQCNHVVIAQVCKTIDWEQPLPRSGEYVSGLDSLDGAKELLVQRVLHRIQDGGCRVDLPPFNIVQLRLSYRELERIAGQKGWILQKL